LARDDARKAIDQLKLRPTNAPVTASLTKVYDLFKLPFAKNAKEPDQEMRRMTRLLCVFSDRTAACWDAKDVPGLHDQREAVPPALEQLQQIHGTLPALVELLESLRRQLPPAGEQDYPDH